MPRPLRKADDYERENLDRVHYLNMKIQMNIDENKNLASERREIVKMLRERGWSMYGIALETNITPNTVKRILESE